MQYTPSLIAIIISFIFNYGSVFSFPSSHYLQAHEILLSPPGVVKPPFHYRNRHLFTALVSGIRHYSLASETPVIHPTGPDVKHSANRASRYRSAVVVKRYWHFRYGA